LERRALKPFHQTSLTLRHRRDTEEYNMADTPHSERAHAKTFSCSKGDTWINCTIQPSYVESLNLPEPPQSPAAAEGTAAHELLDLCLELKTHPQKFKGKEVGGVTVTQEAIEAVSIAFDYVMGKVLEGYTLKHEIRLDLAVTGEFGTVDVLLYNKSTSHLIIADYKHGRGVVVSPVENKQLRLYVLGALDTFKLWNRIVRITLCIIQPRSTPEPQEWDDSIDGIKTFRDTVADVVRRIKGKTALDFGPGEKACQWCVAKAQCKAHAVWANKQAGIDFDGITAGTGRTPSCSTLSLEEIGAYLSNVDAVEGFIKSLRDFARDRLEAGQSMPGWKLVEGKPMRQWTDETKTYNDLIALGYAADSFAPRSLAGLGVVGELFDDKKARKDFIDAHTTKRPGKISLARADDPRPAVTSESFDFDKPL
jgi:hypothetical protein